MGNRLLRLATLVDKAGVDGLVASGQEVEILKEEFGDRFTLVVPVFVWVQVLMTKKEL